MSYEAMTRYKGNFLSEGSQSEKATDCMIPTINILEKAPLWRH